MKNYDVCTLAAGFTVIVYCACSLVAAGDPKGRMDGLYALMADMADAEGAEYFALKEGVLAVDGIGEVTHQLSQDASLPEKLRMVCQAIWEETGTSREWEQSVEALGAWVGVPIPLTRALPRLYLQMFRLNPRELEEKSEAAQILHMLSRHPGLLFEVISKHTPNTIAELVANAHVLRRQQLIKRAAKDENAHIRIAPLTREQWLESLSGSDKRAVLEAARCLAARALVLRDSQETLDLLEAMARCPSERSMKVAVRCLGFVGSDEANRALRELREADNVKLRSEARKALRRR